MSRTQVDHDCRLGKLVKTGSGVTLGGSVEIGDYAYLGMNAVVHQRTVIGCHAMIGMNGEVLRHIPPYAVIVNRRFTRVNKRGLEMRGWDEETISAIEKFYRGDSRALNETASLFWSDPIRSFLTRIGSDRYEAFAGS